MSNTMLHRKSWDDFRNAGLLWWINRALHLFGWAIVVATDDTTGEVREVYPAHCQFRGFASEQEDDGFKQLTQHLAASSERLLADVNE